MNTRSHQILGRSGATRSNCSVAASARACIVTALALVLALLASACSSSGGDLGEAIGTSTTVMPVTQESDAETDVSGAADDGAGTEPATTAAAPVTHESDTETDVADRTVDDGAAALEGTTVTLVTHDSFALSPETLEAFTESTGIEVTLLGAGDAGALVSQACLTADAPLGDVLFGIDNTFLQRGLDCGIFASYETAALDGVPDHFELDPQHRVTPIDFGDVCINYWKDAFDDSLPPPATLEDLIDPDYADMLVVQNPETSSPGLAFLLATIAQYGDGWEDYWTALRANGVSVTAGWEDAYYGEFVAGGGERPIVVSYASSPPAEVIYADPPVDTPPTGVVTSSCYRQIEFAGVLSGAANPGGARALIDFMLTPTFQDDVPLNMFVFPVAESATLPPEFVDHAEIATDPHILEPSDVESKRNEWTERWVQIVLALTVRELLRAPSPVWRVWRGGVALAVRGLMRLFSTALAARSRCSHGVALVVASAELVWGVWRGAVLCWWFASCCGLARRAGSAPL